MMKRNIVHTKHQFSSAIRVMIFRRKKKGKSAAQHKTVGAGIKNLGWDAKVHATQLEQNLSKQDTDAEQKFEITDAKKSSRSRIYCISLEKAITWQKIITRHASGSPMGSVMTLNQS